MHRRYQHPEALPDEAFIINVKVNTYFGGRLMVSTWFGMEKWKTKRMGGIAYDCDGNELQGYRPMFVKKEEVLKVFLTLDEVSALTTSYYK